MSVEMRREDVERIVRIEGSVQRLEGKLDMVIAGFDNNIEEVKKDVDTHDSRLDSLEKWRYGIGGSLLLAVLAILNEIAPFLPF